MTDTLTALRRAATRRERATSDQRALIVQARAEGASLRAIADAAGLSHVRVLKILRGE